MAKKKTKLSTIKSAIKRLPDLPRTQKFPNKKSEATQKPSAKVEKPKPAPVPKKRPRKPRKKHATRQNNDENPLVVKRRDIVWVERGNKKTYREISAELELILDETTGEPLFASVGMSPTIVFADYQYLLNLQYSEQLLSVEQFIEDEINTVDKVEFYAQTVFQKCPTKEFGDLILSCVKERAKLRNLYKPKKIEIDARGALARLLGISEEELPDDSAAE